MYGTVTSTARPQISNANSVLVAQTYCSVLLNQCTALVPSLHSVLLNQMYGTSTEFAFEIWIRFNGKLPAPGSAEERERDRLWVLGTLTSITDRRETQRRTCSRCRVSGYRWQRRMWRLGQTGAERSQRSIRRAGRKLLS